MQINNLYAPTREAYAIARVNEWGEIDELIDDFYDGSWERFLMVWCMSSQVMRLVEAVEIVAGQVTDVNTYEAP